MKTLFLKNMMPFAVIVMGVSGAFVTTSMQSVSEAKAPAVGYIANSQNQCLNIPVACDDTPRPFLCRLNGVSGAVAYEQEDGGNCVQPLYRP
ncbi:hypothetical protein OIU80_11290 [Flavobacterium sp. LS1R47]|uniref:DUF333 domain-containing protein n=1 Tax=Flavobacterium frigoritolerans TaxID=2987686 RepID=A0A9X2Z0N6_9FLAO|nr:DUF6520 family protein [Flavobacterium frigoritolerans]MCV9932869.1 hypothetical protein [Flavobacterium frigoritolerans]